ncbi:E3 ubiquitin-protein ligase RNF180 isoform X1 [Astyanax mexicanus]|uniref:E3 ubiquitin-protein ligase RNF180 isoform X1 n=2 Tax=Astyanax mexicanus TaxID=7994 RepID=UPI0020CB5093|nr:E3 ubiquitin-protein ligase RNF180 isoform X1 [Astyanax mexicanus]
MSWNDPRRRTGDRPLSAGGPEPRLGLLTGLDRSSAEELNLEAGVLRLHPDSETMSGRTAEALCLEVRRPQRPASTAAHRKAFSLDYGSRQRGCPAGRWGPSSAGVDMDVLQPDREDSFLSSSDSGRNSPVPVHRPQDSEPAGLDANRSTEVSHLDVRPGGSFHPPTPSSSEQEQEVLGSPSRSNLALPGSNLALAGSSLALSGSGLALVPPAGERRLSKREMNRVKSLRRRQRRRERWRLREVQDNAQSSIVNPSSSSDEDDEECSGRDREGCICAVCLDVYFCPYMCHPCNHVFCEPCLRTLAKNCPANTPCPLCRTTITHVFFQKELNHTARTFFPKEYLIRKQNFQKASCAKWPLPSCRKLFRIFGGFQRQSSPIARRQFPHGGYRLDALDFEDDSRGWRFDMDMVIIYIYSVNWVIGFIIFIFLCYCFFPSL